MKCVSSGCGHIKMRGDFSINFEAPSKQSAKGFKKRRGVWLEKIVILIRELRIYITIYGRYVDELPIY